MNLKDDKQQNIQKQLDFSDAPTGEARKAGREETESSRARSAFENPASTDRMMEAICEWGNLKEAMWRVKTNKGSAGIDGMTVDELPDYPQLLVIREQLLSGVYEPQPVKRVEIPKPDGGVRKLGIPTALDRFVQQAVMQVLQQQWDRTFSDSSYGFRPGRSTHQAVAQAQQYIAAGYGWVVDLDLEKFFDRVNHDKLMGQIAKRVRDKRKVNDKKSAVARPQERKFLGFSFTDGPVIRRRIAPKAVERFKERIREITRQAKGVSLETTMAKLAPYMRGWRGYFGFCETPDMLINLTRWVRLRLRAALWRQWKTQRRRRAMLIQLGVRGILAGNTAASGRGPWHLAHSKALNVGLSNAYFRSRGLPSLFEQC